MSSIASLLSISILSGRRSSHRKDQPSSPSLSILLSNRTWWGYKGGGELGRLPHWNWLLGFCVMVDRKRGLGGEIGVKWRGRSERRECQRWNVSYQEEVVSELRWYRKGLIKVNRTIGDVETEGVPYRESWSQSSSILTRLPFMFRKQRQSTSSNEMIGWRTMILFFSFSSSCSLSQRDKQLERESKVRRWK